MRWTIEFDDQAERDLAKLDRSMQRRISRYLDERIASSSDPRSFGHALTHELAGTWRYRVGDYRILCRFEDDKLVILVIAVGHRSVIYDR
jgi:mRNA interferase RelE/StbE